MCTPRHGTNASLDEDHGLAWWQGRHEEGHHFWKHLILKLPTPIEADKKVFHWNGGNSECDRQVAAAALLEQLLKLEEIGTAYHLVGHSHGGSVLWAALCLACERGNSLSGLLSWTTVGTPFLCFELRSFWAGLRVLATAAYATVAIILAVAIMASSLDRAFLFKLTKQIVQADPEVIGSLFIVLGGILAVCAALFAWPYLRFRRAAFEREAARRYGERWSGINSSQDEAINFLMSVDPVTGKLMPRWKGPLPAASHPKVSRVAGFANARRRYRPARPFVDV